MKIVNFTPGLGNQIFEYVFSEYLRKKYPRNQIYGYYNPKFLNEKHNGLEVHKMFDIQLPPSSHLSNTVAFICRLLSRFVPSLKATDKCFSEDAIYFDGWWQNKKFFLDTISQINFKKPVLDAINNSILGDIYKFESVSIHIRRGDYLEPRFVKQYGNICTMDYYIRAIEIAKKRFKHPKFFVFSNDICWCEENLKIDNVVYVTNNQGINSWIDMYLMSKCKANILANSSFSYWGAMLNKNTSFIIYPDKWFNYDRPDMFPENWIAI